MNQTDVFRVCCCCGAVMLAVGQPSKYEICYCGKPVWSHSNLTVMVWFSTSSWWNPWSWGTGRWVPNGMGTRKCGT